MPFDEKLAAKVRGYFVKQNNYQEKYMFGGLTFMLNGHMCCGVIGKKLMVRVSPTKYEQYLEEPFFRRWDSSI